MNEYVAQLQSIQKDMVGIITPAIITAAISVLTLFVNSFMSIFLENRKYNNEQNKILQSMYSELKVKLIELEFIINNMANNKIYSNIEEAIFTYIKYRQNKAQYRNEHKDEELYIDDFILSVEKFVNVMSELYLLLVKMSIPSIPAMHPILKYKIKKMIMIFQCYTLVIYKLKRNEWDNEMVTNMIYKLKKQYPLKADFAETSRKLLDKWYLVY